MSRCNVYGGELPDGHGRPVGGLIDQPVAQAWYCPEEAVHRFRWVCEAGHRGDIVELCEQHYAEMMGLRSAVVKGRRIPIPFNARRDVQVCPRCASLAPDCDDPDHQAMVRGRSGLAGRCGCREPKVRVRLVTVS